LKRQCWSIKYSSSRMWRVY